MFVTGPQTGNAKHRGVLCVTRAERRAFTGPADFLRDPGHRADIGGYLSDMVRPYGLTMNQDLFGAELSGDPGHSYGEMAEALIGAVVAADDPVDLLILAFAIHDMRPGRATATYLSHVCPGNPLAFAICDQGSAAAFTGLRLAREYLASGDCQQALLIVVEQAGLPYRAESPPTAAAPSDVPARHTGVALLCDGGAGGARLHAVRQHTDVAPARVDDLLTAETAELAAGRADVVVVLSNTLAGHAAALPGQVRIAPDGQPYTGVWWELAGSLSERGEARRVLLADYDPGLRYLCLSATDHE